MKNLRINLLLMSSALIWGFAFVAQRAGMQFVGPFTYNAVRFALGTVFLLPFLYRKGRFLTKNFGSNFKCGIILGVVLFIGSAFQQSGIVFTSAGNAGFVTGLYVIIVPMLGMIFGRKSGIGIWLGAVLAVIGLYLLNSTAEISVNFGNMLVLISSVFWALHVLLVDKFTISNEPIILAVIQFFICSILNIAVMFILENPLIIEIWQAIIPLLYGGLISVGIGFTLQVVAQKKAQPAHAAIILSLEAVFAVIGGIIILKEEINTRIFLGCISMLSGMLVSQLWLRKKREIIGN